METTGNLVNMQFLTIKELSRRSRLSESTIHRLKRAGRIPFYQPGGKHGRLLFPSDAIEQTAQNGSAVPTPASPPRSDSPRLSGCRPAWQQAHTLPSLET